MTCLCCDDLNEKFLEFFQLACVAGAALVIRQFGRARMLKTLQVVVVDEPEGLQLRSFRSRQRKKKWKGFLFLYSRNLRNFFFKKKKFLNFFSSKFSLDLVSELRKLI